MNINQNHATVAANSQLEDGPDTENSQQKHSSGQSPLIPAEDAPQIASSSPMRQRGRGRLGTGGDAEDGGRVRARVVGEAKGRASPSSRQRSRTRNPSGDNSGGTENGDPMVTDGPYVSPNESSEGHDGREIIPAFSIEDNRALSPWHSAKGEEIFTTMTEIGVVGGGQKQHQYNNQQEGNKQGRLKEEGLFDQGAGGDDSTRGGGGTKNGDISYTSPDFRVKGSRDTAEASTTTVPQEPFGRVEHWNDGSREESDIQLGSDVRSMPIDVVTTATTTHNSATQTPLTRVVAGGRDGRVDREGERQEGTEGKLGRETESRGTFEDGTGKQERALSAFIQRVRVCGFGTNVISVPSRQVSRDAS